MPHDILSWVLLAVAAIVVGFFWSLGAWLFGKLGR